MTYVERTSQGSLSLCYNNQRRASARASSPQWFTSGSKFHPDQESFLGFLEHGCRAALDVDKFIMFDLHRYNGVATTMYIVT